MTTDQFRINHEALDSPTNEMVLHNLLLAKRLWNTRVRPEQVNLNNWLTRAPDHPCGAVACFGGHIALWPEFTSLPEAAEQPYKTPMVGYATAEHALFGCDWIFNAHCNTIDEDDADEDTPYYEVLNRIDRRIAEVECSGT